MPLPPSLARARSAKSAKVSDKRVLANRYQIEKRLGSGNFGTAWLVKDLKCKDPNEQMKVLKEISVGDLQPDETVDAMHEANLLKNLDHPGIVKFFDSFIDGEFFCIVTEYCEGGDLDVQISKRRKEQRPFSQEQVVEWLIQLLLAVQYMHSRRVLHRDLKARNIFLRKNLIKIGDFGISRILMGTTDMASTFTGTPYYMSPEVLKHEGYNSKSDVWSVGCLVYDLVALTHAFEGHSLMSVMYTIVEGSLPEWPAAYSDDLKHVFHKLMIKEPSKRPSASEALKLPYIASRMEALKNTMIDKHQAKENRDVIHQDTDQIARALNKKSRLEQLRRESEDQMYRNLSPRERMRLRKQQKADEEARRLSLAAKQNLAKNKQTYDQIRTSQDAYAGTQAPWLRDKPDLDTRPYTAPQPQHEFDESEEDEDDEGFADGGRSQELYRTEPAYERDLPDERNRVRQAFATYSDDRPITPMKNKMVYDPEYSSLDFEEGIPVEPKMAETYYAQFDEEFEKLPEDDEDDDEGTLLAPVYERKTEQKPDEEVSDLICCMQNALDRPESTLGGQTLTDDTVTDVYGPAAKEAKIKNIRTQCIKKLGEKEFDLAYSYIKDARFGNHAQSSVTLNENKLMMDLKRIVSNPNDCFLVEQLLFLEEQSKLS